MNSWFEKCMPKVKDVSLNINNTLEQFKKAQGIKSLYLWGSYARNIDNPNFRVRDIDVLAKTKFNSGDLLSIDNNIIKSSYTDEYLEDQGYDPCAVKYSKDFLDLSKYNIDCWTISSDRKLLHWGPVPINLNDSHNVNKEAESYANRSAGITRKKMNKSSEDYRRNWFEHYDQYIDKCFQGMPSGWYKTEDIRIKDIIGKAIKL